MDAPGQSQGCLCGGPLWRWYGDGQWRLYDVAADPGETRDLANEQPRVLQKLRSAWDDYAEAVAVIPTE